MLIDFDLSSSSGPSLSGDMHREKEAVQAFTQFGPGIWD